MKIPLLSSHQSSAPASNLKFLNSQANAQQKAVGEKISSVSGGYSRTPLEVVEQTLTRAYEKLGLQWSKAGEKGAGGYAGFEPLSAEKVAANILGFIERRLLLDAQDGATAEELQSRLEAGLSGFKQGFAEAKEKLEALNMLTPGVAADIGRTYDLVTEGIEALRAKFIPELLPQAPAPNTSSTSVTSQAIAGRYDYMANSRFEFELVTAEGDRVSIYASSLTQSSYSYAAAVSESSDGSSSAVAFQASQSHAVNASWRVEGDLNESELGAIGALLERLDKLSREFFQGNLSEAFNQALSLGYDEKQIVSFSLNLTQIEVQRVQTSYRAVSANDPAPQELNDLRPLGHFARHLLDLMDSLPEVREPRQLLLDVAEKMLANTETEGSQPGEIFRSFIERLLDILDH
mgnify:CR=1 FL=1|jgi:hypothetical protein